MASISLQRAMRTVAQRTVRGAFQEYSRKPQRERRPADPPPKSREQLQEEADRGHELHRRATLSPCARAAGIYFKVQPSVAIAYWGGLKFAEAWCIDTGKLGHADVAPVLIAGIGVVASFFFLCEPWLQKLTAAIVVAIPVWYLIASLLNL